MARVKRGVTAHAKHKKILKAAKGFRGRRKNTIRAAKAAVDKSMQYAYRDRKNKKRTFRALWIQRINAAVREFGLTYSRFIDGLAKAGIEVDRKVLSESPSTSRRRFTAIVEKAKGALPAGRLTGPHAHVCRRPAARRAFRVLTLSPRGARSSTTRRAHGKSPLSHHPVMAPCPI